MRLELTRRNRHYPLKVACLPIPPPTHLVFMRSAQNRTRTCTVAKPLAPETSASTIPPPGHFITSKKTISPCLSRAEDGTRTRDPNLGKVMLYQLSYFRISLHQVYQSLLFLIASAKVSNFFISPNFSTRNLIRNINFISVHTDIIPLHSLSSRSFQYSSGIFINSKL